MADQKDRFVFVVNEIKPFGRPLISTINSQVAKYAHSRRRRLANAKSRVRRCPPYFTASIADTTDDSQSSTATSPSSELESGHTSPPHPPQRTKHPSYSRRMEPDMVMDYNSSRRCRPNTGNSGKWDEKSQSTRYNAPFELRMLKGLPSSCIFPADLNSNEQYLMHHWFTRVFPGDFSTTLQFDGFMGPLGRYPITFAVPLRWAVAKAAERLLGDKITEAGSLVCQSRSKAIEQWRGVMGDPYISTDEMLASAIFTIVKNDGNERMHLKGLDTIIAARGGIRVVLKEIRIVQPEHIVHMYTFAPFIINTYKEFLSLKTIFFTALENIQSGIRSSISSAFRGCPVSENDLSSPYDILSEHTVVGRHIRLAFDNSKGYSLKARHFCAMLMLNLSLLSLDLTADRSHFLRELEKAANAAGFPDSVTGQLRIRAGAFVFMVGHVYGKILRRIKNIDILSAAVGMTTSIVAAMKIFGILSDTLQLRFFACLQKGLIHLSSHARSFTQPLGYDCDDFDDLSIAPISQEVNKLWLKHKCNSQSV